MKILISIFVYNEAEKFKKVLEDLSLIEKKLSCDILIVDDGSNDETSDIYKKYPYKIIRHEKNLGLGISIREAIHYARSNSYYAIVIMAGNGKMQASQIEIMKNPIINDDYDYVQGSRFLKGGDSPNLPFFRHIMIKLFSLLVWLFTGHKGTDVTCGFRAYKLSIFDDPDINLSQEWLNKYELEFYIHYYVIKKKFKIIEVPISMRYPDGGKNYSKIKPFIGWYSMIRPWVFLLLGIKK